MSSTSHVITSLRVNGFYQQQLHLSRVTARALIHKAYGLDTILQEYIILMCFTEVRQQLPLLIVNMITAIIRTCMP